MRRKTENPKKARYIDKVKKKNETNSVIHRAEKRKYKMREQE